MKKTVLELNNISKVYDNGLIANKDINLEFKEGEIHALMGENGAGKSTLMNIIFGEFLPSSGDIYLNNKKVVFNSPSEAIENGIGMVHQHFKLVNSLTISQNIYLGMEPKKGLLIDRKKMNENAEKISKIYNFDINPKEEVNNISVGEKQKVEILKALARGAKILILDEPTAVLTPQETEELFKELINLKNKGHTIIFISHKINEVLKYSDRISIIRKGKTIGTYNRGEISENEISNKMVGRDVVRHFEKTEIKYGEVILDIKNLTIRNEFNKIIVDNISFEGRQGSIIGIAGVEGNGQNELVKALTGYIKKYEGEINIKNNNIKGLSIRDIRNLRLSHISDDRIKEGVALDASISENFISTKLDSSEIRKKYLLNSKKIEALSEKLISEYKVKTLSPHEKIRMLSGGNMQKVVIAREFSDNPILLIANQPTRGVDIGSAEFIYRHLFKLRELGVCILMISSDLNEILELSDKVIVMYDGKITGEFNEVGYITEEELGYYMLGVKNNIKNKEE